MAYTTILSSFFSSDDNALLKICLHHNVEHKYVHIDTRTFIYLHMVCHKSNPSTGESLAIERVANNNDADDGGHHGDIDSWKQAAEI